MTGSSRFFFKITAVTVLFPVLCGIVFAILFCRDACAQIKVYERPSPVFGVTTGVQGVGSDSLGSTGVTNQGMTQRVPGNEGVGGVGINLYSSTSTRKLISLNGEWNVSFNEGKTFNGLIIPCAYTEQGTVIFKKKFAIDKDTLARFSFLLVCEGIQYEAEIKINDKFIIKQAAASSSLIIPLDDGVITGNNEIYISVNNELSRNKTLPTSNQINYGNLYGGINRDIYIVAVPKVYTLRNFIDYSFGADGGLVFRNVVSVRSTFLRDDRSVGAVDTVRSESGASERGITSSRGYYIQTKIFKKSTGEQAGESGKQTFKIDNNNLIEVKSEQTIKGIAMWSPDDPQLYVVKTYIYATGPGASGGTGNDELIDEYINETGFRKVERNANGYLLNGKDLKLNGINYYEDSYKYGNAISYQETEKDIENIKKLGFNSIRVPGASPNPYILKLCDRYGLFVFYDIPFNTIPSSLIGNLKTPVLNYLTSVVIRDRNSPSIFAWGLGNDLDVKKQLTADYLKAAVAAIDTLNKRFTYYTTTNYHSIGSGDICDGFTDMMGINFYDNQIGKIEKFVSKNVKSKSQIFVSYYGAQTEYNNRNGFSDPHSYEYQTKYITDAHKLISKITPLNIIGSYADWNAEQPLLYHFSDDDDMRTNGLYTAKGEAKQAPEFIRRVIMGEENPKLQEGENHTALPQIFLVTGIIFMLVLLILMSQYQEFRILFTRALLHPTIFFQNARDMVIHPVLSLFVTFVISIGIAVFLGNIFYYFREINNFDLLVSGFITSHGSKVKISDLLNSPVEFLLVFSAANILMNFATCLILWTFSVKTRARVFFRNIYTIAVWSTLPLIAALVLGTFFLKIMPAFNGFLVFSLVVMGVCYLIYLFRLFTGIRIFFEISNIKSYLFGLLFTILLFGSIFLYFKIFTSGFEVMGLVLGNLN